MTNHYIVSTYYIFHLWLIRPSPIRPFDPHDHPNHDEPLEIIVNETSKQRSIRLTFRSVRPLNNKILLSPAAKMEGNIGEGEGRKICPAYHIHVHRGGT